MALARAAKSASSRVVVAFKFEPGGRDGLLLLVDPMPGLPASNMIVELDLDPSFGVTWTKVVEAWGFCKIGLAGGVAANFNVGAACANTTPANDFRSGCTTPQKMVLTTDTATELWFRKGTVLGAWVDAGTIDWSMWLAFGGRSVRFLWRSD
jgi:hypothetical protein